MSDDNIRDTLASIRELCAGALADDNSPAARAVGYQAAISLCVYEGSTLWAKFNAMLVGNTLVVAFATFAPDLAVPVEAAGAFGVLLCMAWYLITRRSFGQYAYWFARARELEAVGSGVETVTKGAKFAAGEPVQIQIGGKTEKLQLDGLAKLKVRYSCNFIIGLFAAAYIAISVSSCIASAHIGWIDIGTYDVAAKSWSSPLALSGHSPQTLCAAKVEVPVAKEASVYREYPSPMLSAQVGVLPAGTAVQLCPIERVGTSWWARVKRSR